MQFPENLKYTKEHEWIKVEDNQIGVVGITDYAQSELGDIVYVELPQIGKIVKQLESFGTIEAVKAVSDLFSPVSGEVIEVNEKLKDSPDLINKDPYGEGWIIKIKINDLKELDNLLSAQEYRKLIGK
jgi:glycine cleavage system H protein